MPYKNKAKQRKAQRDWVKKNRAKRKKYDRELRLKAIEKLGGKCVNCGCDNVDALEFNHKNGGGYSEYKAHGGCGRQICLDILARRRDDIELTCKVCNALHCLVKLKRLPNKWKINYGD